MLALSLLVAVTCCGGGGNANGNFYHRVSFMLVKHILQLCFFFFATLELMILTLFVWNFCCCSVLLFGSDLSIGFFLWLLFGLGVMSSLFIFIIGSGSSSSN